MPEGTRSVPVVLEDIESRLTLSIEEVATLLGLGRSDAYEAARRGEIPTRRLGRRVIVPVAALLAWLGGAAPGPPENVEMQGHIRKRIHTTKDGSQTVTGTSSSTFAETKLASVVRSGTTPSAPASKPRSPEPRSSASSTPGPTPSPAG